MKSYEGKLATLTAINSALQSENEDLRRQLKQAAAPNTQTGALLPPAFSRGSLSPSACACLGYAALQGQPDRRSAHLRAHFTAAAAPAPRNRLPPPTRRG